MIKLSMIVCIVFISGCSMFPYEESSSCTMDKDYGKCIDIEGAYNEAVTGVESDAPKLQKASEMSDGNNQKSEASLSSGNIEARTAYNSYQDTRYQTLKSLIDQPATPMLSPPKTVRTLIISYSPSSQSDRLYMPRYVFSIIENSKFVLGSYLNKNDPFFDVFNN